MKEYLYELGAKVQCAIEADMMEIIKDVGKEQIYAASLVTDSDYSSLYFVVNTYECMRQKDEKYLEMFKNSFPLEKIEAVKNGSRSFVKWIPAEWGYSKGKNSELVKVSEMLFAKEKNNSTLYAKSRKEIMDTIIAAYKRVISKGLFDDCPKSNDIIYFVSTSDGDHMHNLENLSSQELNTDKNHSKFLNRFEEAIY